MFRISPWLPGAVALLGLCACAEQCAELALGQSAASRRGARARERFDAPPPEWDASVLDLFFTDARAALGPGEPPTADLANSPPATTVPPSARPANTPATPTDAQPAAPTDGASADLVWSKLVSPETLEDEIKSLAQALGSATQNAGQFKSGGFEDARVELTVLAVLFGVIDAYDGDVRFHDAAGAMRDRLGRAGQNCKAGSDATFQEAKTCAEELNDLVRGNSAAVEAKPPLDTWATVADRRALMARFEQGLRDRLAPWTANQTDYERHAPELLRETELLAVLASVVQDRGYEYGDDATYQEYTRELADSFAALAEALRANDFSRAQAATAAANRSCDRCHADFRG